MKRVFLIFLLFLFIVLGFKFRHQLFRPPPPTAQASIPTSDLYAGISYTSVATDQYDIALLNKQLSSPTRVKFTPDSKFLLVSQLTGELFAFTRSDSDWNSQPNLVTKLDTNFSGFPPEEAGLVGIAFSSNYQSNHKIFLLYTFKDSDGKVYNRISSTTVTENNNRLWGSTPTLVFQANTPGTGSHQITDGYGLKNRLIFLIGEGFKAAASQDPSLHAGKLMSIAEDGSDPQIHALGVRNAYVLEPFLTDQFLIADTGPEHFDRLIKIPQAASSFTYNFNWDGSEASLEKPVLSESGQDLVLLRLPDTKTITGLASANQTVYATVFGKTGSKSNDQGKEIWKGSQSDGPNSPYTFTPIIRRHKDADAKYGNPIGLAQDPQTGHLFFADILEGRLYQAKLKGGENN